jgi:hypothetical protein
MKELIMVEVDCPDTLFGFGKTHAEARAAVKKVYLKLRRDSQGKEYDGVNAGRVFEERYKDQADSYYVVRPGMVIEEGYGVRQDGHKEPKRLVCPCHKISGPTTSADTCAKCYKNRRNKL